MDITIKLRQLHLSQDNSQNSIQDFQNLAMGVARCYSGWIHLDGDSVKGTWENLCRRATIDKRFQAFGAFVPKEAFLHVDAVDDVEVPTIPDTFSDEKSSNGTSSTNGSIPTLHPLLPAGPIAGLPMSDNGTLVDGPREYLVGFFGHLDFSMNFHSQCLIPLGGLTLVGTELTVRGIGLAKHIVKHHLNLCRQRGQWYSCLHPFRPDFYSKLGYSFGGSLISYTLSPSSFPKHLPNYDSAPLGSLRFLNPSLPSHRQLLCNLWNDYVDLHHGGMHRQPLDWKVMSVTMKEIQIVGFFTESKMEGYLSYLVSRPSDKDSRLSEFVQDLDILEFCYTTSTSLSALLGFLHSLKDQFRLVTLNLLSTDLSGSGWLSRCLVDARVAGEEAKYRRIRDLWTVGGTYAIGPMYRITDLRGCWLALNGPDSEQGLQVKGGKTEQGVKHVWSLQHMWTNKWGGRFWEEHLEKGEQVLFDNVPSRVRVYQGCKMVGGGVLKVINRDSFDDHCNGQVLLEFQDDGHVLLLDKEKMPRATIQTTTDALTDLLLNSVEISRLLEIGKVLLDKDSEKDWVSGIFFSTQRPMCPINF